MSHPLLQGKINFFFTYLKKGKLQGVLYEKIFVYNIPRCVGYLWTAFYALLYPDIRRGKNFTCWGKMLIMKSPQGHIKIGDYVKIISSPTRASITLFSPCKITVFGRARVLIGDNVWLIGTSITCRTTSVEIGEGSIIAPNVIIVDSDFHALWPPENRAYAPGHENDSPVSIGKNVWIGMNSLILKGVSIGENSVIAAGSVVVKDIPKNVLAGGVPARTIRELP